MVEKIVRSILKYADEAHHSAANSYKKVMDCFTPKLWLGMTATPDKRDDNMEGRNIYEIFNHQIAYEIRLQDAMKEDLLCPFHYFAITDLEVIADSGKSMEEKIENFRYLTSDERVGNVMKQAEFFGYDGDRVKGLIFCSRIDEAKELSRKFNEKGWRTLVLWAIFIRKTHKPLFCCGHQPTASWELSSIYSAIRRNSSAYLNFTLMFPPS